MISTSRKIVLSLLVAGLMAVTCPIAFYFRFIYPDMVAALLALFSFRIIRNREQHTTPWVFAAIGAAVSNPWHQGPGALVGMGIPEYQAKRYEGLVKNGSILLSVHADDSKWTKLAKTILEKTGATDISSTGESKGDYANSDKPRSMNGNA